MDRFDAVCTGWILSRPDPHPDEHAQKKDKKKKKSPPECCFDLQPESKLRMLNQLAKV